ncbi:MAG TPA: porin family protein [Bacteroidales bacterium]|nr:porin family protein [Bacteroidales bacterium]
MKIFFQYLIRNCLLLIFLVCFPLALSAQEAAKGSCAEKLQTAQNLFDRGQVEQVAGLLHDCLKSGFTREESLSAYKLIIQTYLFEDELEKADSAMLDFLRRNPEYQLSETDHSSFVHLFNNFQVKPLVQISLHFGTSLPFTTFVVPRNVPGIPTKGEYSAPAFNLYGSIEAKFKLTDKIELNGEAGYSQITFTNTEVFSDVGTTNYKETQSRIEVPLSATYNITNFGKFTPYARLGAGPAVILSSVATVDFKSFDQNGTDHTGTDLDRKDSRLKMDIFAQAGAGMKYKTRGGYLFAEVRGNFGIFNQSVRSALPDDTHSTDVLRSYYYHADDDFNLNALNFSIGYTQIFYKPSKKGE